MESDNYIIQSDSINIGGIDKASSTSYVLTDTSGESGTGKLTGVLYYFLAGYRQMVDAIVGVTCDDDSICETGETESNCPNDCGCNNNGTCESARGETTANCPNDCPAAGGGGAGNIDISVPNIYNLSIFPTTYSAVIKWQTSEKTITNLFWGKTSDYKEGTIAKADYATQHSVLIENLTPNSSYHFQIKVEDASGNKTFSQDQSFKTMALPDEIPPSNVSNLEAEEGDAQLKISWQNPPDPDFEEVRIVKNNQFYPQDTNDGEIVYQGKAEHFIDEDVLDEDYYYTIFSYDNLGNYSSGAIIKAKPTKAPPAPSKPPVIPPVMPPTIPPELKKIGLEDIVFTQDGKTLSIMENNSILADAGKPMKISIDYDKLPEVLKTIIISLNQPEDESAFSFLLRVNDEKTEYSATIISPYEAGVYPLSVSILDFQHQQLKELEGKLLLRETIVPVQEQKSNLWVIIGRIMVLGGGLGALIAIGYAMWRWIRVRARRINPSIPNF